MNEKILVIKSGGLGDFIRGLGSMEALRRQKAAAHITLLTTQPFLDIAQRSHYFNEVIVDTCPAFYELHRWYSLFKKLNTGHFARVYDLQADKRAALYHRLFLRKPEWSGLAPDIEGRLPDLSWMTADIGFFGLKKPYVLLVPGSSPQHPAKRWPVKHYSALALRLAREGCQPVILGTETERDVTERIAKSCPEALDLTGRTSLYDIAALAREAAAAIGNDTGPVHLAAQAGCPVVALFNAAESDANISAPIGRSVRVIETDDLDNLSPGEVYKEFNPQAASS